MHPPQRPAKRLESLLSHRLIAQTELSAKCAVAWDEIHASGARFDAELVEVLVAGLRPVSDRLLGWAQTLPATANAAYLRALFAGELSHPSAVPAWHQFFA